MFYLVTGLGRRKLEHLKKKSILKFLNVSGIYDKGYFIENVYDGVIPETLKKNVK